MWGIMDIGIKEVHCILHMFYPLKCIWVKVEDYGKWIDITIFYTIWDFTTHTFAHFKLTNWVTENTQPLAYALQLKFNIPISLTIRENALPAAIDTAPLFWPSNVFNKRGTISSFGSECPNLP